MKVTEYRINYLVHEALYLCDTAHTCNLASYNFPHPDLLEFRVFFTVCIGYTCIIYIEKEHDGVK